jgi:hypothetical protein
MSNNDPFSFGPDKYAAFNLIMARWIRHHAVSLQYRYVTLGGTELYDVANVSFVNNRLVTSIVSYEADAQRFSTAQKKAERYKSQGLDIEVLNDDVFEYQRDSEDPHIFYLDFTTNFSRNRYQRQLQSWFEKRTVRSGDLLLITSYLGTRLGWSKILDQYKSDFAYLNIANLDDKKQLYLTAHPLLVLAEALIEAGFHNKLSLVSLGCLTYRNKGRSRMGLYGIACENGKNDLALTLNGMPYFYTEDRSWGYLNLLNS